MTTPAQAAQANARRAAHPTAATAAAPPARRMTMGAVKAEASDPPIRLVLVAVEGVGKTTFAASAERPVFIAAERGLAHLNPPVPAFPQPRSWTEVLEAVDSLVREPHDFKTVVFDTLDWIEHLLYDHIQKRENLTAEKMDAYGRWAKIAVEDWRQLLRMLEVLQDRRGMNVVALVHAVAKPFKNPEGDDYQRWKLALYGEDVPNLWKQWAEAVFFGTYEISFRQSGDRPGALGKAETTGNRVLYTTWSPARDAKNRYGLPEILPMDWQSFVEAKAAGSPNSPENLYAAACALAAELADPAARERAADFINAHAGDAGRLARAIDKLRFDVEKQKGTQQS